MEKSIYMVLNLNNMEVVTLNKKEFVEEVSKRCMLTSYVVEEVFNVSFGVIGETLLKGQKVDVPKLGSFSVRERKDIEYQNLFGKGQQVVEGYQYPAFQISAGLKNRIKNGNKIRPEK